MLFSTNPDAVNFNSVCVEVEIIFVKEGLSESSTVYDSAFILSAHSNSISGNKTPVSAFVGEDRDIGFSVKSGCTTLSSTFLI